MSEMTPSLQLPCPRCGMLAKIISSDPFKVCTGCGIVCVLRGTPSLDYINEQDYKELQAQPWFEEGMKEHEKHLCEAGMWG